MPFHRKATEKTVNSDPSPKESDSKIELSQAAGPDNEVSTSDVTYLSLFRYGTRLDILGLVISSIFAIAGGAILPTLTVRVAGLFGCL